MESQYSPELRDTPTDYELYNPVKAFRLFSAYNSNPLLNKHLIDIAISSIYSFNRKFSQPTPRISNDQNINPQEFAGNLQKSFSINGDRLHAKGIMKAFFDPRFGVYDSTQPTILFTDLPLLSIDGRTTVPMTVNSHPGESIAIISTKEMMPHGEAQFSLNDYDIAITALTRRAQASFVSKGERNLGYRKTINGWYDYVCSNRCVMAPMSSMSQLKTVKVNFNDSKIGYCTDCFTKLSELISEL